MAKQMEGVYEEVLEAAKQEFLSNGFEKASLRNIATKANTTTGFIYSRFTDKAGLFATIVEETASALIDIFTQIQENFHGFDKEKQRAQMGTYTASHVHKMVDYIYEKFDACKLLIECSAGTSYEDYVNRFVMIEETYTKKYVETVGVTISNDKKMDDDIIHMVTTAYFESFFEIIRHNMEKEIAMEYIKILGKYQLAGFNSVFHLH